MAVNLPNKIDFISRVCLQIYREGRVEKKMRPQFVSFLVLFIKQIKAFKVAYHLLVPIQAFVMMWMQLKEWGQIYTD